MLNSTQIELSFKRNTYSSDNIVSLVSNHPNFIGFDPKVIRIHEKDVNGEAYKPKRHLKLLNDCKDDFKVSFESKNYLGPRFSVSVPGYNEAPQVLTWIIPHNKYPKVDFIKHVAHNNFLTGYVFDSDYVLWQTESVLNNYKAFKKPYEHLSTYWDHELQLEKVDISNNPGRMTLVKGTWIMASWKMYFGTAFYQYISKDKLLSFKGANQIKELENGIIYIELYEDNSTPDTPENANKLAEFRHYFDLDNLELEFKLN